MEEFEEEWLVRNSVEGFTKVKKKKTEQTSPLLVVMLFGTPAMWDWPFWGVVDMLHLAIGISEKQPFWFWAASKKLELQLKLIQHWLLAAQFQLHCWTVQHAMKVHGNLKQRVSGGGGKYQPSA